MEADGVSGTKPEIRNYAQVGHEGQQRMARLPAGTLEVVPFCCALMPDASLFHRGVEVQRVIVELKPLEKPSVQAAEHTLVVGLRELVEVTYARPVACASLPAKYPAQAPVVAEGKNVIEESVDSEKYP